MYRTSRANNYFISAMIFFISASILLTFILDAFDMELPIAGNIALSQLGFVFLPVVVYFIITGQPVKKTLLLRSITWANVGFAFLIGLTILPILSFLNVLSQLFVKNYIGEAMFQTLSLPYWLNILLIGCMPAIFEELSTRAIIISNYRAQKFWITCLVSGLFFGILHLNINQFTYAFFMGAVMAFTVMSTGTILSSMVIHFTINSTMISLQTVLFKFLSIFGDGSALTDIDPTREEILASIAASGIFALLSLPFISLIFYAMLRYNKKTHLLKRETSTAAFMGMEDSTAEPDRVATPAFIMSIFLFVTYVVIFELILV